MSQKEKDAHHLAMLILYVIPHLAPLVAKLTNDRTLENLSSDVLCADLFKNHPKSKAAYIEAETRIGSKERLVSKLQSRRLTQLGTIATLQKEYRRAYDEIKEKLKSDDAFSADNVEAVLDQLKLNQFGFSLYEKFLAKEDDTEELFSESLLDKMKAEYESIRQRFDLDLSTLQKLYRGTFTNLINEEPEKLVDKNNPFSIVNSNVVSDCLKTNPTSEILLKEQLGNVGDDWEKLLVKMKERFDMLSANAAANFENDLSRLQSLYRKALTENEKQDGGSFSSKHFEAVEKRLKEDPESATLLKEQLTKVGGNQEELLIKMKEKYDSIRENFDLDLSTLQSLFRNALSKEELDDGNPFSLKHFKVVEERLKTNPTSEILLKDQLAKVGGNQEELLAKMKERFDTLSTFGGNQYISHTSEGDVVDQIFQFHLGDLLVLTTTKGTNINVKGMNWDTYERFKILFYQGTHLGQLVICWV